MKQFIVLVCVLLAASVCAAMTIDDVIQLSKLKTGDDLILQTLAKSKLDHPVSPADVIRMKQEGVSEPVIQELLKQSKAVDHAESVRSYTAKDKSGKPTKVYTNLDENGNRMGAPASEPATVFELPELPKEEMVVRHEAPAEPEYPQEQGYAEMSPYYPYSYGGYGYGGYNPYGGMGYGWMYAGGGMRNPHFHDNHFRGFDRREPLVRPHPTPHMSQHMPSAWFASTRPRTFRNSR